jgi:hypothetical protein
MKNRRSEQQDKLTRLRESGQTDTQILEWILSNFMSADDACDGMDSLLEELGMLEKECPSCGSVDVFNSEFDYNSGHIIYQCNDCEDRWFDS